MKVLMSADTVGGVWTYALELADALAEHGVEVTLAAMGAPLSADQRDELRACRVARFETSDCALEWMDEPWQDVDRAGEWLLQLADESEPDVVHLNGYAHAALPWEVPVVVVGHSDVLSWHQAVRGTPAGPEWGVYRRAVQTGLAAAALLVAPTQAMLDELIRLYDPACPRLVIANASRRAFPTRPKEELVLAAGRMWDDAKNVAALLRLAPRLPWPLVVAGPTAGTEPSPNARMLGRLGRNEMDDMLAAAAIFAAPATYEPFGLAALEAGRSGCALVLGDIPSLHEVWGDAALFADPRDDAALEHCLRSLIEDPRLRSEYARRGHRRALRYSSQRMARSYVDAYRSVLHRNRVEVA
ncbi:MAG: glycosyltransferase family 1 protein [Actinomycetia bacterium]|nr:glycosyltransferase family 1 protein [Actinomycetes bacterium]